MRQRLLALLLLAACSRESRTNLVLSGYDFDNRAWARPRGGVMEGTLRTARFMGTHGPWASYSSAPACVSYEGRGVRPVGGFR